MVPSEKQADIKIVDHMRKEVFPGTYVAWTSCYRHCYSPGPDLGARKDIRGNTYKNRYAMVHLKISRIMRSDLLPAPFEA